MTETQVIKGNLHEIWPEAKELIDKGWHISFDDRDEYEEAVIKLTKDDHAIRVGHETRHALG